MTDIRILLVEDDPSIREVTAIGLGAAGFVVTTASDGVEGIERFNTNKGIPLMGPRNQTSGFCCVIKYLFR